MTRSRRFFRLVWRLNALIILGTGLLAGLVVSYMALMIVIDRTRPIRSVAQVRVDEPKAVEQIIRQGWKPLAGTPFLIADVEGVQSVDYSYRSKISGTMRNRQVLDPSTGTVKALLPDDKALVVQAIDVQAADHGRNEPRPVVAMILVYLATDTDGDGRLADGDLVSARIFAPDGAPGDLLAEGVEAFESVDLDGATVRFVIRQAGKETLIDLDRDSRTVTRRLAIQPPG